MSRKVRLYITALLFFILSFSSNIKSVSNQVLANTQQNKFPPLLLNSGLIKASEAEVRVIIWFEEVSEASISPFLNEQVLSQAGWKWETQEQEPFASNVKQGAVFKHALTVSGYRHIDASQEAEVLSWFRTLAQKAKQEGGKAYFDERVPTGVDIEAYLHQNSFEPKQRVITGTTISIAGWQEGFFPEAQAGQDPVNIQLLTRSTSQGAKTVLAIPVLLEEF